MLLSGTIDQLSIGAYEQMACGVNIAVALVAVSKLATATSAFLIGIGVPMYCVKILIVPKSTSQWLHVKEGYDVST